MENQNGEFKGSTTQALHDMRSDVRDLKDEVRALRRWLTVLSIVTAVAVLERLPNLLSTIAAVAYTGP